MRQQADECCEVHVERSEIFLDSCYPNQSSSCEWMVVAQTGRKVLLTGKYGLAQVGHK